ncbi:hypothetical protein M407DRAFT_243155 [Tulasnella calospora MUT 4182]|uniref:LysM domain-containing protein n=1 Tax=Tulasnella calospora MUT 4182 TaxID=1051891 RepID=A0A0C3QBU9_9AGAM|nr:hypothetical protein M407DRAFT_243155 [Tulasnella calospora MUT 4182]
MEPAPLPLPSSTSTPIKSRHSHDVASPFSDGSIGRRRNFSDGNYESYSKAMAGLDPSDGKTKDKGKGKMMEEQCEVIAHEVQPTDSLAGVALKYGVQIADIRKANKLWASDTIHLRKTLYIPVDVVPDRGGVLASVQEEESLNAGRVAGASENRQPSSEIQTGWTEDKTSRHPRDASSGSGSGGGTPSRSLERRTLAVATIRRVPASELSFFPPPSGNPQRDPSAPKFELGLGSMFPVSAMENDSTFAFPQLPSAFSSSLRGLPSLFNTSLPTLPTISSPRISFSSEGTSEQSSDVEMDELGWPKQVPRMPNGAAFGRKRGKLAEIDFPDLANVDVRSDLPPIGSVASTIRPASITTQFQGNADTTSSSARLRIRNQQPAPSPMMALPGRTVKPP